MVKELRKEMIKGVIEEIRGPRFGPEEVISYDPWDEYLIGTVIPIKWKKRSERNSSNDSLETSYEDNPDSEITYETDYTDSEDGSSEVIVNSLTSNSILNPNSQIRTFGISFSVQSENPTINICTSWARYTEETDSEEAFSLNGTIDFKNYETTDETDGEEDDTSIESDDGKEEGKNKTFWKRKSCGYINSVTLDEEYINGKEIILENDEEGVIKLFIRRYLIKDDNYNISIYLLNDLIPDYTNKRSRPETEECLFQPSIRVILDKNLQLGMDTLVEGNDDLDFMYRKKQVVASGHSTSVIWDEIDYKDEFDEDLIWPDGRVLSKQNSDFEKFFEPTIRSEFVPLHPINLPKFDLDDVDLILKAETLANSTQNEIYDNLNNLVDSYSEWICNNEKYVEEHHNEWKESELDIIHGNEEREGLLDKQKKALNRIREGIELIKNKRLAYLSFCFANKTISLQNEWDKKYRGAEKDFEWRPFQLAFILMNLESIYYENSENKDVLDLLWIPTGGGKTEAYLGIMAYTMALRRLKAHFGLSQEKTGAGVSIISRYTLRLLTVQQFRRTLKMVTAAECLRVWQENGHIGWRPDNCSLDDDWIYGSVRFSTGMWVGGAVTPLHLNKKNGRSKVGAMHILKGEASDNASGNPAQIIKCPVCGSWLSVPKDGLTDDKNEVHIVVGSSSEEKLNTVLTDVLETEPTVYDWDLCSDNNEFGIFTIKLIFNGPYDQESYIDFITHVEDSISKKDNTFSFKSLNILHPGYFNSRGQLGRIEEEETDFEIWCTNPECKLNHFWKEGAPKSESSFKFPDGNFEREILSPFKNNTKIPIPAYLIDEHVYYRCPTVIVSTADKIARLAFEPRAGSIFGNVDKFNEYYGYYREDLFPQNRSADLIKENYNLEIESLSAPDLIIQDELHLMDGPLGSLFGLYEAMVSFLMEKENHKPKYIASTATINNAEKQVNLLFAKKHSQFPPYGMDITDSYFVKDNKENLWDEENKGRVYLGIYSTGLGHFTHQVRIYSRLLKLGKDYLDEENSKYYWTLVGYYSAIKQLGSAVALYKDDIVARLKQISVNENIRSLNPEEDKVELSSRIDSTELPLILDKLERDGSSPVHPQYNTIFTTSMFGTGVDISHLSTMVINSQPKTTGSYIQASGRVGRSHGGLIIDLLVSGRIRDLNHYEMFSSYHSRLYREVEPVSVSPFSKGCLSKGLGPSMVAYLRSAKNLNCNWTKEDGRMILEEGADEDIKSFSTLLEKRLLDMQIKNYKEILNILKDDVIRWKDIAIESDELTYYENSSIYQEISKNVVLGDPEHEKPTNDLKTVYKNSPQSLREVEDTLGFWV